MSEKEGRVRIGDASVVLEDRIARTRRLIFPGFLRSYCIAGRHHGRKKDARSAERRPDHR